ncbi:O-antigen ligase family protein [Patescibacteria group bacterium]|nr:O-antigen ligase family protein [Patescibacteria group bacterium]
MFYILQETYQHLLLLAGLIAFGLLCWRRLDFGLAIILFLAPLYLLKIGNLPLTALELLIFVLAAIWLIKKSKPRTVPLGGAGAVVKTGIAESALRDLSIGGWWLPVGLILAGVLISVLTSGDIKTGAGIFKAWFLEPIIFGLIAIDVIKTNRQFKSLLLSLVFSGTAVALVALGYLAAGQLTFDGRLKAFYLSPNHLAMFLAPALILAIAFWFETKKQSLRILLFIVCCLLFIVLYSTFSYAAWLAVLAATIFLLIGFYRSAIIGRRGLVIVLCLLVIVLGLVIFFQMNNEKLANLLQSDRSSLESRLMVWRSAGKILADNWLFGIGPGMFQQYYLEYQKYFLVPYLEWAVPQPHNLFLAWWLQAGITGLAGFVLLLIKFFRKTLKFLFKTKQPLFLILAAAMVYILAHGLLDTTYWKNDLALVFWAVIALGYIVDKNKSC